MDRANLGSSIVYAVLNLAANGSTKTAEVSSIVGIRVDESSSNVLGSINNYFMNGTAVIINVY